MSISDESFQKAQDHEMANWVKDTTSVTRILYELVEHSEIEGPLNKYVTTPVERSLEVGCGCFGLGFMAAHFSHKAGRIDGIDPLPRLEIKLPDVDLQRYIDALRSRVNYQSCIGERMPFDDATFDLITCINVVDHAQSPESILQEIQRVLKPGGTFAFSVSTLSFAGEKKWHFNRWRTPNEWLFVAHPHTYQWTRADAMLRSFFPNVLWCDRPNARKQFVGKGRMSYWITQK